MRVSRIGIDARLLGYRKGGIAEYTRQLVLALAELDAQREYVIIHRSHDTTSYTPAANFQRINAYTPAHHRLERYALSLELLPRRLDVLHSPDFIPPQWGARRHIITIHDLHFLHYPHFQTADSLRYYRDQIGWAARHADHIFAQTEGTRREIIEMLGVPAEKITVHLLGVHESFRLLPPEAIQSTLDHYQLPRDYLLFVSTIEPRKNLPNLFRAYATLPDAPPLVLAGQRGWNADESFETIERLGLQNRVRWLDAVPFERLPALYNGATLLVLPSYHEGFGLPAIEAMACGTPVVVSNRGSLPEVVRDNGVYVEPDSIESIAAGIQCLLDDRQRATQLRDAGLRHAATYSWRRTAEIALQIYQQVLDL